MMDNNVGRIKNRRNPIQRARKMMVSPDFDNQIREFTQNFNAFLEQKDMKTRMSKVDISDILAKQVLVKINPEDVIYRGRGGKRILFNGEIKL